MNTVVLLSWLFCTSLDARKKTGSQEQDTIAKQQKDHELKMSGDDSSHEEGEFSQKNELNNGHGTEAKSGKTAKQNRSSDDSIKSRFVPYGLLHLSLRFSPF